MLIHFLNNSWFISLTWRRTHFFIVFNSLYAYVSASIFILCDKIIPCFLPYFLTSISALFLSTTTVPAFSIDVALMLFISRFIPYWNTEVGTKWLQFCRWHFQIHFCYILTALKIVIQCCSNLLTAKFNLNQISWNSSTEHETSVIQQQSSYLNHMDQPSASFIANARKCG